MRHRMCILNYLVIMILRVYALYNRSLRILVFLLALWAAQIIMSAYGLRTGYREQPFLSLGKLFWRSSQAAPLPKGLPGKRIYFSISSFLTTDLGCILSGQGPLFRTSIKFKFDSLSWLSPDKSLRLDFSPGDWQCHLLPHNLLRKTLSSSPGISVCRIQKLTLLDLPFSCDVSLPL